MFVYGFGSGKLQESVLTYLTEGEFRAVATLPSPSPSYSVSAQGQDLCRQFSGLTFGSADAENDLVFVKGDRGTHFRELITIGGAAFMLQGDLRGCNLVLAASRGIIDLDRPVGEQNTALYWFSQLVPPMLFLRRVFGDRCWHNDYPSACLILDDPPLWETYGYVEFEKLARSMEELDFTTSVAFIPWNHRRSTSAAAALFQRHSKRFSLCVHGCDHTEHEFGSSNISVLIRKARTAMERMRVHATRTGVPFDNVMVFPQGAFSTKALRALEDSGFVAAINTEPRAVDRTSYEVCIRDLLDLAADHDYVLPVFRRRSLDFIAAVALDLFLGKPVFLVAHPEDFRLGNGRVESCVRQIRQLCPNLVWMHPEEACTHACLERDLSAGARQVLFCTRSFSFKNQSASSRLYEFITYQRRGAGIEGVVVNGNRAQFSLDDGALCVRQTLAPGQEISLRADPRTNALAPAGRAGSAEVVRAFVRRRLSEVRDTVLRRSSLFLKLEDTLRSHRRTRPLSISAPWLGEQRSSGSNE